MTQLAIRQSGGASIVSIPKAVLKILGLHVNSKLELSIVESNIVLTPVIEKQTLAHLLDGTPKEKLDLTDEDLEWINMKSIGKEI